MPVIVVGADTPAGMAILGALIEPDREVRAFVSSAKAASELKRRGVKVALGDVSDASHVEGACLNAFSAVLVAEAASDDRERSFATGSAAVLDGWVEATRPVRRVIWVGDGDLPHPHPHEVAIVPAGTDLAATARRVAELDGADARLFAELSARRS